MLTDRLTRQEGEREGKRERDNVGIFNCRTRSGLLLLYYTTKCSSYLAQY